MARDLKDTPFSVDRLVVWALGAAMVLGALTVCVLAYQEKTIPPNVSSFTMAIAGAFMNELRHRKR
jgi:hypothetical protein